MKAAKILIPIVMLTAAPLALAEGLPVEPGLWEMTSTISMPMLPQPRVNTMTECFEKSEFSMDDMNTDDMDPNCTFEMDQLDGNTMKWSVDCPVEGGTSHGEWEAISAGETMTGSGVMTISMQGQTMKMDMSWEGRRIGDCM